MIAQLHRALLFIERGSIAFAEQQHITTQREPTRMNELVAKIVFALVVAAACWVGELEEPVHKYHYSQHHTQKETV